MDFIGQVAVANGGTDADPVAAPASVLAAKLIGHAGEGPLRDRDTTQRFVLSFVGSAAGQTTTVEVWALDEATAGGAAADRRFYRIATGVVLTHKVLTAVAGPVPASGPFYIRQTAGAATGVVMMAVQGG